MVLGSISRSFVANDAYENRVSFVRVQLLSKNKPTSHKDPKSIKKLISNSRHSVISMELLMKIHGIGLDKVK